MFKHSKTTLKSIWFSLSLSVSISFNLSSRLAVDLKLLGCGSSESADECSLCDRASLGFQEFDDSLEAHSCFLGILCRLRNYLCNSTAQHGATCDHDKIQKNTKDEAAAARRCMKLEMRPPLPLEADWGWQFSLWMSRFSCLSPSSCWLSSTNQTANKTRNSKQLLVGARVKNSDGSPRLCTMGLSCTHYRRYRARKMIASIYL